MPSFDFEKHPAYARARLKMNRWGPEKRAIFSTAALDESFADQQMRRYLEEMALNTWQKGVEGRLGLARGRLGLQRKAFKFEKGQRPMANLIAGGHLLTSTGLGYARMREGARTGRLLQSIANKYGA